MNELASIFPWVSNLQVKVIEKGDQVVFLHKVVPGGANKSYGIQVASLAGLPVAVVQRARTVWNMLEQVGMQMNDILKTQLYRASNTNPVHSREEPTQRSTTNGISSNRSEGKSDMEDMQQQLQAMKQQLATLDAKFQELFAANQKDWRG